MDKEHKLKIERYKRPKYAKANNEGVITYNLPTRPIEKCIAGAGLLAHIHVSKFVYHLPFYRQVQRLKQNTRWLFPAQPSTAGKRELRN